MLTFISRPISGHGALNRRTETAAQAWEQRHLDSRAGYPPGYTAAMAVLLDRAADHPAYRDGPALIRVYQAAVCLSDAVRR